MKTALELKIIRYQIIMKHREMVRKGLFQEATLLLHLLRRERLSLGLGDEANTVEHLLEDLGLKPTYSHNYNVCRFYLKRNY